MTFLEFANFKKSLEFYGITCAINYKIREMFGARRSM